MKSKSLRWKGILLGINSLLLLFPLVLFIYKKLFNGMAIGIIGGADGPTSIYLTLNNPSLLFITFLVFEIVLIICILTLKAKNKSKDIH